MPNAEMMDHEYEAANKEKRGGMIRALRNLYQELECPQNGTTLVKKDIDREHEAGRFAYNYDELYRAFTNSGFPDILKIAHIPALPPTQETQINKISTEKGIDAWFENFAKLNGRPPQRADTKKAIDDGALPSTGEIEKICGKGKGIRYLTKNFEARWATKDIL